MKKTYYINQDNPVDELNSYNWRQAFSFAGELKCYNSGSPERACPTDVSTSIAPFGVKDVVRIIAKVEGENDEADWLCLGELYDGRFFFLHAGCDYTGWD